MIEDKVLEKLVEMDSKVNHIQKNMDTMDSKVTHIQKNMDTMDSKVNHIQENMVTKEDYLKDHGDMIDTLQHIAVTVDRLDSERLATRAELDRHEKDIKFLKKHPGLS